MNWQFAGPIAAICPKTNTKITNPISVDTAVLYTVVGIVAANKNTKTQVTFSFSS